MCETIKQSINESKVPGLYVEWGPVSNKKVEKYRLRVINKIKCILSANNTNT